MSKKQVVGGRVYCWNYTFIIEGSQDTAESWRQELMLRPWRGDAYWFASHGLLSLLSYRSQIHQPKNGTTSPSITN